MRVWVCLYSDPISYLPQNESCKELQGSEDMALSSAQHSWRKAQCRSTWGSLPSILERRTCLRRLAQEVQHPALKIARRRQEACACVFV